MFTAQATLRTQSRRTILSSKEITGATQKVLESSTEEWAQQTLHDLGYQLIPSAERYWLRDGTLKHYNWGNIVLTLELMEETEMPIGSESDRDIVRPKHQMAVPGLGVFIAPNAVARLFQLHDYTKCPRLGPQKGNKRVLYPILRPNVRHCPRYYHLRQAARFKNQKRKTLIDVERNLTRPHIIFRRLLKDAQKVIHRIIPSKNLVL